MKLLLDGVAVPGYDHKLTAHGQIDSKDLSGDTSSTGMGHEGWKAWVLQVRCRVNFDQQADLLTLRSLFQAEENTPGYEDSTPAGTGVPYVYKISEDTAAALGIFKVRFNDQFRVEPLQEQRRWEVVFNLIEVRSIPEKREERTPAGAEAAASAPTGTQTTAGGTPAQPEGWLESLAAKIDAALGAYVFPDGT
jgi:hypothetical protein